MQEITAGTDTRSSQADKGVQGNLNAATAPNKSIHKDVWGTSRIPNACIITMGCAKNEVDSAKMRGQLQEGGWSVINDPTAADVIIVNTCSFIQAATEESLETIFEVADLKRVRSGQAKVVVAGCMPARYGDDLSDSLTEASRFVPCSKEDDILSVVDELIDRPKSSYAPGASSIPVVASSDPLYSAYVKISDGCDRFCSYCTIPFIRGRYHSFTFEVIEAEVTRCIDSGAREIVLIAQDTGRWGQDFDQPSTLARLMARLAELHPDTWFRVMYLQPEGVTDELLAAMASHDNICSYLDIPFQHADERLLTSMNRQGSRAGYQTLIEHVRSCVPGITLRTTMIAGYPGERDEDFEEMIEFIDEADLDYVGVFAYSQEEGTRAARLSDQVDEAIKQERAQRLRDVADAHSQMRVAKRIGSTMDVLVLGCEEDGRLIGRAQCQAPDVDGVVYLDHGQVGEIVQVDITDTFLYEMEGECHV